MRKIGILFIACTLLLAGCGKESKSEEEPKAGYARSEFKGISFEHSDQCKPELSETGNAIVITYEEGKESMFIQATEVEDTSLSEDSALGVVLKTLSDSFEEKQMEKSYDLDIAGRTAKAESFIGKSNGNLLNVINIVFTDDDFYYYIRYMHKTDGVNDSNGSHSDEFITTIESIEIID